jgi:hypothetical protein
MPKEIIISKHALEQMKLRNISEADALDVISNPENIIAQDGLKVYQKVLQVENKSYLFRIFVNDLVNPNMVVTVYRTSKISKYYEGEI